MPARMSVPVIQRVDLVETDERLGNTGEPSYVEVRQARILDTERRADISSKRTIRSGEGPQAVAVDTRFNYVELMRFDVYTCMTACNLLNSDGDVLFRFTTETLPRIKMSEHEFIAAWAQLDDETAAEIHNAVLKLNPAWGTVDEDEDDTPF